MKKITLTIFLLIILMTTSVFAATEVTMEIVEDNICTININEDCSFEKKIVDYDLTKHEVTLQLKINNNSKVVIPEGELMLLIDSSSSMDQIVEGEITRKNLVLNSANKLVESLLEANPSSLKIGVTTFSSSLEKDDNGYLIIGTAADAQKVCDFTNNISTLTNKISSIEGTGQYTNLDAGIKLATSQFSNDNSNKYLIILTDGLPNLAVGHNDLVSYDGATNVINQTKSTLMSLDGIDVITMLTGIAEEDATFKTDGTNSYTYGQVINKIFGTEENPTKGKFYNINDIEIESTITNKIYHDLLPIEKSLKDITIIDYIPQYIADNFNISINKDSIELSAIVSDDFKTITWNLEKLAPGESKILKFDLVLKENFDEEIIGNILDTNEKVDINYKDYDERDNSKSSDVTPKIKLVAPAPIPDPDPDPTPKPEPKPDEPQKPSDTAQTPFPNAGSPVIPIVFALLLIATIFFGYKSKN